MAYHHFSYAALLRQRVLLAALTLGLLAAFIWVFIDVTLTSQRNALPITVRKLAEPLNPVLDLDLVSLLEKRPYVTLQQARQGVELQLFLSGELATPSAEASPEGALPSPTPSLPLETSPAAIEASPLPDQSEFVLDGFALPAELQ